MKKLLAVSLIIAHVMSATFFLVLACQRIVVAQEAKQPPVVEQKAERPKFDYERVPVYEYLGLGRERELVMKFSLLSKYSRIHASVEVSPELLQVGVGDVSGTVLSFNSGSPVRGCALLELPTEEAAAKWREYLEVLRRRCLYVCYPAESDCWFVFDDGVGMSLVINDGSFHVIPDDQNPVIIGSVKAPLNDTDIKVESGIKMHVVVEWGKAIATELPGISGNDERYYEIHAPQLTIYVPDVATQEAWQARIEAERKKLAPHIVLPPVADGK